jgi:hypothetical protein
VAVFLFFIFRKKKMAASSSSHTFVHQIQNLINWIDSDARHLTNEELLDSIKIRVLVLAKKFIAFPHCQNFSLMPQPQQQQLDNTTT